MLLTDSSVLPCCAKTSPIYALSDFNHVVFCKFLPDFLVVPTNLSWYLSFTIFSPELSTAFWCFELTLSVGHVKEGHVACKKLVVRWW